LDENCDFGEIGSTRKGNLVYLHILRWPRDTIELPDIRCKVVKHSLLTCGNATVSQDESSKKISVPKEQHDKLDTIIKLEFEQSVMDVKTLIIKNKDGVK